MAPLPCLMSRAHGDIVGTHLLEGLPPPPNLILSGVCARVACADWCAGVMCFVSVFAGGVSADQLCIGVNVLVFGTVCAGLWYSVCW